MRNLKKFLALVLSMMMVLSLFVTVSAKSIKSDGKGQEFNDTKDAEFITAIEVLNGMEVLKGDANPATGEPTGNFRPNDTITRAEVAALVFRLSTGQTGTTAADHYARYGNFSDVAKDAWYAGYVGYCANAGYVKGYAGESGPFGPSDPVTGYQALAMILRAMGYGVNGEFEGANWQLNVSQVGTQTGILDGINNSHFGNETLYGPAPRQVVAEIYFQAIQTPCVVYTPAFGYQTTDVSSGIGGGVTNNGLTANSTLGFRYFGLTMTKRIILGNKDTGEANTVLGSPVDVWSGDDHAAKYDGHPYAYPGSVIKWDSTTVDEAKDDPATKTDSLATHGLTLKVDTDIMMFGHKVTAYFDGRSYSGARRTYAIYDEAKYAYAYSKDGSVADTLGSKAADAKMSVDKGVGYHISDRFGWISDETSPEAAKFGAITDANARISPLTTPAAATSNLTDYPVLLNANATKTGKDVKFDDDSAVLPYGSADANGTQNPATGANETGSYYMLISNGTMGGNVVDLVITLAPELERVTEHDTTSKQTVRLSGISDVALTSTTPVPSTFGVNDDGYVRFSSLTENSEKGIGSLVVGWEIKGTNYDVDYKNEVIKGDSSLYKYYLQPVTETVTGTVKYYNADTGEVTVATAAGDKTLNFTRLPIINYAVTPPLDRHNAQTGNTLYFYNGQEYTFKIDPTDKSRYVEATQGSDYKFLYTTYGDYEVGGLGTGDLSYFVTGVDWDGKIQTNLPVSTINKQAAAGWNYETLTMAKKNLGSANGINTIGNEVMNGVNTWYTGYGYNAGTKDLDVVPAGWPFNNENWVDDFNAVTTNPATNGYTNRYWAGKLVSDYTELDDARIDGTGALYAGIWTVDKGDVADGWSQQTSGAAVSAIDDQNGRLLLTPNTKFIIVEGTGTSTLKVDIRDGIAALLGTADDVTIDVRRFTTDDEGVIDGRRADWNVYYQLFDEQFNNYYTNNTGIEYSDDNWMVKTVILPKSAITWSNNDNLWFTVATRSTGTYLADIHGDTDHIEQYVMYKNGEQQKVFIDINLGTFDADNPCDDAKIGMFYKLTEAYKVNGISVFQADRMVQPELENVYGTNNSRTICNLDLYYNYTAVNNLNTARLTQNLTNTGYGYWPTTGGVDIGTGNALANVYNVTNANVTNLASGGTIKDILSLNQAVSTGYRVTVAIVNNGHAVTQFYVTNIEAPGTWTPGT